MTRVRVCLATCLCLALTSKSASADDKAACAAAYDQTQTLRDTGKLIDARKQALACSAPTCPAVVVKDCTQWLADIEASLPTVVFEVIDASGHETTSAKVLLDGKLWPDALDGHAKAIDPGKHMLRTTIDGGRSIDDTVQIRQGEKNRKLTTSFRIAAPMAAPTVPATPLPREDEIPAPPPRPSVAPWVIGGVGVVGLVSGAVMGGFVIHDHAVATDPMQCSTTLMKCTAAGASAEQAGKTLGPATTAALVIGGVGVGVGAVWLIARRAGKTPPLTGSLGASLNGKATTWDFSASW